MMISVAGIEFIRKRESLRCNSYLDTRSNPHVWTIGYGATGASIGEGTVWTAERAEQELEADLQLRCAQLSLGIRYPISQQQFDAIVSLAYNNGVPAILSSTLLRKFNAGDVAGAAREFTRWCHDGDPPHVDEGLLARRTAELVIFTMGDYG